MQRAAGPPPQRPSSMNPLGPFNRLGSMPGGGSGNTPGSGPVTTPGSGGPGGGYMPRVMSGSGTTPSPGQGAGSSPFTSTGAFGTARPGQPMGPGASSNAFGRNFPFGSANAGANTTLPGQGPGNYANPSGAGSNANANLDLNDFPALGGTGAGQGQGGQNGSGSGLASLSYASQAGTPIPGNVGLGSLGSNANRASEAFTNDDFPALSGELGGDAGFLNGAQSDQGQTNQEQVSAAAALQHQHLAREQHRRDLLGAMAGSGNGSQGRENGSNGQNQGGDGTQALSAARGGFGEPDRNYATKLGMVSQQPPGMNTLPNNQSWSSSQSFGNNINGLGTGTLPTALQSPPSQSIGLDSSNASDGDQTGNRSSAPNSTASRTPAHQVLSSPADRFGLLGLLSVIKMQDPDLSMLALGSDLQSLGLGLDAQDNLSSTFVTPWSDNAVAASLHVEPDFHLPSCYNVQPPPPAQEKIAMFSDETLFFVFYSTPRDILQEMAAQELYNRNWRFYRGGLNLWLTKEESVQPTHKDLRAEKGVYVFWDPASWSKVQREFVLAYDALEERGPNVAAQTAH